MNTIESINNIVQKQREYFLSNETKSIDFRLKQLKKLKHAVEKYSDDIYDALWRDLHKCKEEAFLTEINIVLNEINNHIKNLKKWARPMKVKTPLYLFPSKSFVKYEPYGVALIIAPWNYPFQLMFAPLVGAISSGCCAVLHERGSTSSAHKISLLKSLFIGGLLDFPKVMAF